MTTRIAVQPEGKKFKVMVNGIQQESVVKSVSLANIKAVRIKEQHYPKAILHLL